MITSSRQDIGFARFLTSSIHKIKIKTRKAIQTVRNDIMFRPKINATITSVAITKDRKVAIPEPDNAT